MSNAPPKTFVDAHGKKKKALSKILDEATSQALLVEIGEGQKASLFMGKWDGSYQSDDKINAASDFDRRLRHLASILHSGFAHGEDISDELHYVRSGVASSIHKWVACSTEEETAFNPHTLCNEQSVELMVAALEHAILKSFREQGIKKHIARQ